MTDVRVQNSYSKCDLSVASVAFDYITIKHNETSASNYTFKLDVKIWGLGLKWRVT